MLISEVFRARADEVARVLSGWPVQDLLKADVDAVTDEFARQHTMETHEIIGKPWRDWIDPAKHSDGFVVTLPIRNPRGAGRFFEFEPNPVQRIGGQEPNTRLNGEGVTFEVTGSQDAEQILRALTANINQRNLDVAAGNASLKGMIRPIVEGAINAAKKREAEADARFNESSIPMRPAPPPPPVAGTTDDRQAPEEAYGSSAMSPSSEVVGRTSSQAIRLNSIEIVIAVVREYIDDLKNQEEVELCALYSGLEFQLQALQRYVESGVSDSDAAQGILAHLDRVWEKLRPLANAVDKGHKAYVIYMALGRLLAGG